MKKWMLYLVGCVAILTGGFLSIALNRATESESTLEKGDEKRQSWLNIDSNHLTEKKEMIPQAYAETLYIPKGGTIDCPAKAMMDFYRKNGKLVKGEGKDCQIGTLSNKTIEMKTVFKSCIPETISIKSKTSSSQSFYRYSNGVLITYDTLGVDGEDVLHYDSEVSSPPKLPVHVIAKFKD